MEQATRKPQHPLFIAAAVAVIVFCAVGVAAITGLIPTSRGTSQPAAQATPEPVIQSTSEPATEQPAPLAEPPRPRAATSQPAAKPHAPRATETARVREPAAVPSYEPAPAREPAAAPPRYEPAQQAAAEPPRAAPPAPICHDCGVIESVREIKSAGEGSGVGAVAGGVAGAVLGHQVGGGRGRDLATVVGAVGGALAGHQVEKQVRSNSSFQITVRMDDGNVRTFTESSLPPWRAGDRVRVDAGRLIADG